MNKKISTGYIPKKEGYLRQHFNYYYQFEISESELWKLKERNGNYPKIGLLCKSSFILGFEKQIRCQVLEKDHTCMFTDFSTHLADYYFFGEDLIVYILDPSDDSLSLFIIVNCKHNPIEILQKFKNNEFTKEIMYLSNYAVEAN